ERRSSTCCIRCGCIRQRPRRIRCSILVLFWLRWAAVWCSTLNRRPKFQRFFVSPHRRLFLHEGDQNEDQGFIVCNGHIVALGRFVIGPVCRQLAAVAWTKS